MYLSRVWSDRYHCPVMFWQRLSQVQLFYQTRLLLPISLSLAVFEGQMHLNKYYVTHYWRPTGLESALAYFGSQRQRECARSKTNGQQGAGLSEEKSGPMWVLHYDKSQSRDDKGRHTHTYKQIHKHTYTHIRDKEILVKISKSF